MKKLSIGKVLSTNLTKLMAERPDLDTQTKVAKKSGIGQTTVGRILRNEVSATVENIEAIAYAFGISVSELLLSQAPASEPQPISSRERMLLELFVALSRDDQNKLIFALEKKRDYEKYVENLMTVGENLPEQRVFSNPNRIYKKFKLTEREQAGSQTELKTIYRKRTKLPERLKRKHSSAKKTG